MGAGIPKDGWLVVVVAGEVVIVVDAVVAVVDVVAAVVVVVVLVVVLIILIVVPLLLLLVFVPVPIGATGQEAVPTNAANIHLYMCEHYCNYIF